MAVARGTIALEVVRPGVPPIFGGSFKWDSCGQSERASKRGRQLLFPFQSTKSAWSQSHESVVPTGKREPDVEPRIELTYLSEM